MWKLPFLYLNIDLGIKKSTKKYDITHMHTIHTRFLAHVNVKLNLSNILDGTVVFREKSLFVKKKKRAQRRMKYSEMLKMQKKKKSPRELPKNKPSSPTYNTHIQITRTRAHQILRKIQPSFHRQIQQNSCPHSNPHPYSWWWNFGQRGRVLHGWLR